MAVSVADDALPMVFAPARRDTWVVLVIGGAMLAGGVAMSFDSATLVSVFGLFHAPRSALGWLVALPGLVMAPLAMNALVRGLPRLELREEGIVLRRRVGAAIRVQWREVERVDIEPFRAGDMTSDKVTLVTTDGRKIQISELGPAAEMRDAIMRVKVSMAN